MTQTLGSGDAQEQGRALQPQEGTGTAWHQQRRQGQGRGRGCNLPQVWVAAAVARAPAPRALRTASARCGITRGRGQHHAAGARCAVGGPKVIARRARRIAERAGSCGRVSYRAGRAAADCKGAWLPGGQHPSSRFLGDSLRTLASTASPCARYSFKAQARAATAARAHRTTCPACKRRSRPGT